MANYADMKQAILSDLKKDDLELDEPDTLDRHVRQACEYYAEDNFWFNQAKGSVVTVAGSDTVAYPAGLRFVTRVARTSGDLLPIRFEDVPGDDASGEPTHFLNYADGLMLYPKPAGAYPLTVFGVAQIDPPSDDADSNAWTNEAARLIAAHARFTLYRDVLFEETGTQEALGAVGEALGELQRKNSKRLSAPMRTDIPVSTRRYW